MFITLTTADSGQALDVRADCVSAIELLDKTHTLIVVAGTEYVVRESPDRVKSAVRDSLGIEAPLPGLRSSRLYRGA